MDKTPVTLPLMPDVTRCFGFTGGLGDFCRKADDCARHQTILHENEPWAVVQTPHRMLCSDENKTLFMEFKK